MFNIRISEVEGASQPVRDCTDNYWIWEEGRNLIFRFVKKKKKNQNSLHSVIIRLTWKIKKKLLMYRCQQQHDGPLLYGRKYITNASLVTLCMWCNSPLTFGFTRYISTTVVLWMKVLCLSDRLNDHNHMQSWSLFILQPLQPTPSFTAIIKYH